MIPTTTLVASSSGPSFSNSPLFSLLYPIPILYLFASRPDRDVCNRLVKEAGWRERERERRAEHTPLSVRGWDLHTTWLLLLLQASREGPRRSVERETQSIVSSLSLLSLSRRFSLLLAPHTRPPPPPYSADSFCFSFSAESKDTSINHWAE